MIQTLEAIVDETGEVRLPAEIHLEKSRPALVTILEEELKTRKRRRKKIGWRFSAKCAT